MGNVSKVELTRSETFINWMTVHQFLQFVDEGISTLCMDGSGDCEDLEKLLRFAEYMEAEDLVKLCVNSLCIKANLKEAIYVALFIKNYMDSVIPDHLEGFRQFFAELVMIMSNQAILYLIYYEVLPI